VKVIGNLTKDAIIRAAVSEGLTVTQAVGTDVIFNSGSTTGYAAAFDSSTGKVVIAFCDGTDGTKGKAIVGTVDPSNNSISFGSEVVFQNSEVTGDQMDCVFDSNANKVVIFYTDTVNSRSGAAIVGTVSGTSISFGTKATFESGNTSFITATFDSTNNKAVVFYRDEGNSNYGTAAVGTVSGTGISFGSPVVFNSANTPFLGSSFDSNAGKILVVYKDVGNSNYGNSIVGTVSGTSISFGSEVTFLSANGGFYRSIFDSSANKHVVLYDNPNDSNHGYARVGTISGTSVSFGTEAEFENGEAEYMGGVFDSNAGKIAIVYKDGSNSNRPTFVSGTVSGTDISFDTPVVLKAVEGVIYNPGVAYDSTNKRVVAAYADTTANPDNGLAQVISVGYSSATGGTIADGKPVIVNANGTVSSVSQSSQTQEAGTSVEYESDKNSSSKTAAIVHDTTNNKILIVYGDAANSDYGTAVVGTVSGTSISFGTPVVFESAYARFGSNQHQCATFIDGKIVIVYADGGNSNVGTAIVGTVSGTSISFGSAVVFNSGNTYEGAVVCTDTVNNKVIVAYRDEGNSNYGVACVGTVSGTSISFGSEHTFRSAAVFSTSIGFDASAGAAVVAYRDSSAGKAQVLTVSSTSVSSGSAVNFNSSANTTNNNVVYDSNAQKTVIVYVDGGNSAKGTAIVGTVSGTSISFGSEVVFNAATTAQVGATFDSNVNRIVIAYSDGGSLGNFTTGVVSGTSITFGQTETQFAAFNPFYNVLCFDSTNKKCVVAYMKGSSAYDNLSAVLTPEGNIPNLTTENFVGFMDGATLDGTNGEILSSCSIARNQTSLTPGQTYFVSPSDGALSLTAGSPSVTAGTAISATELIVKG